MSGTDTIAAIATAPGRGGIAVIRVSGPAAFAVAEKIAGTVPTPGTFRLATLRGISDCSLPQIAQNSQISSRVQGGEEPTSREVEAGLRLVDSSAHRSPNDAAESASGAPIDHGLILAFKAPHSYTGEDVVEFQCHGGHVTPRRVLEACFAAGARPARRGEFTERAFLNGRLSYEQAEAVLDLIDAKTDRAADDALSGLGGVQTRELRTLYDAVLALSSTVEHALDVDESDLPDGFVAGLTQQTDLFRASIDAALARARAGKLRRTGALVVLCGAPNAGKSSLLNALLGENRAIVSDVAGTTRDAIEEWVDFDGWPIRLVDTAGLRDTADAIEAEGVSRAEELRTKADVIVHLIPADDEQPPTITPDPRTILVLSKSDLLSERISSLPRFFASSSSRTKHQAPSTKHPLPLSTKTGAGLDALRRAIVSRLEAKAAQADFGEDADRLSAALLEARAALPAAFDDLVLAGNALARAAQILGEPLGATYSDDLLTALFSRFCVGK